MHPSAVLKAAERVRRVHDVGRAVRELVAIDAEQIAGDNALMFVNLHSEDLMDPSALYLPTAHTVWRACCFTRRSGVDRPCLPGASERRTRSRAAPPEFGLSNRD